MDRAGNCQDFVIRKLLFAIIFKIENLALKRTAENGHDEIDIAIGVKISTLHIGYSANIGEDFLLHEISILVLKPDDSSGFVIGWLDPTKSGHEKILITVSIQIE